MKALLLNNLRYDAWANAEWARTLQHPEIAAAVSKAAVWMSHVLLASRIWAERAEGSSLTLHAWETIVPERYAATLQGNLERWERILEREDESCSRCIVYQNLQGRSFETPLYQIATHLTHHGSYHRGQMASALKNAGFDVPPTDAIVYSRLF